MVLFACAIAVKLFTIQLVEGDKWRAKAEVVSTTYRTVQPDRGHIYSEDGRLLATSVPEYDVRMDMVPDALRNEVFQANIDSLAWHLANLFGDRTAPEYKRDLTAARARRDRYFLVKRRGPHASATAAQLPALSPGSLQERTGHREAHRTCASVRAPRFAQCRLCVAR
jgi:cell division protein FtsI (penicillin-binding protein 3)